MPGALHRDAQLFGRALEFCPAWAVKFSLTFAAKHWRMSDRTIPDCELLADLDQPAIWVSHPSALDDFRSLREAILWAADKSGVRLRRLREGAPEISIGASQAERLALALALQRDCSQAA